MLQTLALELGTCSWSSYVSDLFLQEKDPAVALVVVLLTLTRCGDDAVATASISADNFCCDAQIQPPGTFLVRAPSLQIVKQCFDQSRARLSPNTREGEVLPNTASKANRVRRVTG